MNQLDYNLSVIAASAVAMAEAACMWTPWGKRKAHRQLTASISEINRLWVENLKRQEAENLQRQITEKTNVEVPPPTA